MHTRCQWQDPACSEPAHCQGLCRTHTQACFGTDTPFESSQATFAAPGNPPAGLHSTSRSIPTPTTSSAAMQADQQTVDTSYTLSPAERGVWNKCKALQKQENKLKKWEQVIGGWRQLVCSAGSAM